MFLYSRKKGKEWNFQGIVGAYVLVAIIGYFYRPFSSFFMCYLFTYSVGDFLNAEGKMKKYLWIPYTLFASIVTILYFINTNDYATKATASNASQEASLTDSTIKSSDVVIADSIALQKRRDSLFMEAMIAKDEVVEDNVEIISPNDFSANAVTLIKYLQKKDYSTGNKTWKEYVASEKNRKSIYYYVKLAGANREYLQSFAIFNRTFFPEYTISNSETVSSPFKTKSHSKANSNESSSQNTGEIKF